MANITTLVSKSTFKYTVDDVGTGFLEAKYGISALWPALFRATDIRYLDDPEGADRGPIPYLATTAREAGTNLAARRDRLLAVLPPVGMEGLERLAELIDGLRKQYLILDTYELWDMGAEAFDTFLIESVQQVERGDLMDLVAQAGGEEATYVYLGSEVPAAHKRSRAPSTKQVEAISHTQPAKGFAFDEVARMHVGPISRFPRSEPMTRRLQTCGGGYYLLVTPSTQVVHSIGWAESDHWAMRCFETFDGYDLKPPAACFRPPSLAFLGWPSDLTLGNIKSFTESRPDAVRGGRSGSFRMSDGALTSVEIDAPGLRFHYPPKAKPRDGLVALQLRLPVESPASAERSWIGRILGR